MMGQRKIAAILPRFDETIDATRANIISVNALKIN